MTPDRWHEICAMFLKAIELGDAEREAWLAEACAHDSDLRTEVNRLLVHDARASADQFLALHFDSHAALQRPEPATLGVRWAQRRVRCPHCRAPLDVQGMSAVDDVVCNTCGSSFRLMKESTAPWST